MCNIFLHNGVVQFSECRVQSSVDVSAQPTTKPRCDAPSPSFPPKQTGLFGARVMKEGVPEQALAREGEVVVHGDKVKRRRHKKNKNHNYPVLFALLTIHPFFHKEVECPSCRAPNRPPRNSFGISWGNLAHISTALCALHTEL